MNSNAVIETLAEIIIEIFHNGLELDADVRHFIRSTFSDMSSGELAALLADPQNSDVDTLRELIFFPDEAIQIRIEPALEGNGITPEHQAALIQLVCQNPPETLLILPGDQRIALKLPESAVEPFIQRLRLTRSLSPKLRQAVSSFKEEGFRNLVLVKLRNARSLHAGTQVQLLTDFFKKFRSQGPDFIESLTFLLEFLELTRPDQDMYEALINRKRAYFRNLQKARFFEKQLRKNNIETLIMLGVRPPNVHPEQTRLKMDLIDAICRAVFGRTEYLAPIHDSIDMGEFDEDQDVSEMIRRLSDGPFSGFSC